MYILSSTENKKSNQNKFCKGRFSKAFRNFKAHWRLSKISRTSSKKYEVMLFDIKKYICSERLFNTLYLELKHKYEKTLQKNATFFLSRAELITVLLLIRNSYTGWSTGFMYLKVRVGFSILDSVLFLLKFIFLFNKKHGFFDFKTL